jgi:hypothetical protein
MKMIYFAVLTVLDINIETIVEVKYKTNDTPKQVWDWASDGVFSEHPRFYYSMHYNTRTR